MSDRKIAVICILICALCTGSIPVFAKLALDTIPPLNFTFFRFLTASIVITPFLLRERKQLTKPSRAVTLLSLISVINVTAYSFGIHLTTAISGQMLFAAAPLLTTIFAFWLIKERLGLYKIFGVIVGFIGTLLIILLPVLGNQSALSGSLVGNVLVLASVFCLGIYTVLSKQFHNRYSPLYLTALFIYLTAIITGLLAIPELLAHPSWWEATTVSAWAGVLFAGILIAIFFVLFQYAIKHGSPIIASLTQYLAPIVTFVIASLVLNEHLTVGFVSGALLALVGVYLVTKKPAVASR